MSCLGESRQAIHAVYATCRKNTSNEEEESLNWIWKYATCKLNISTYKLKICWCCVLNSLKAPETRSEFRRKIKAEAKKTIRGGWRRKLGTGDGRSEMLICCSSLSQCKSRHKQLRWVKMERQRVQIATDLPQLLPLSGGPTVPPTHTAAWSVPRLLWRSQRRDGGYRELLWC